MKKMFFRLTKADESLREVSGVMVTETPDKTGEVFDYKTSKPLFEKWSDGISKASAGKSLGNVREMHQSSAIGKVVNMAFDDAAASIGITAKIVDDKAWKKVTEGVLTGFSIGGSYAKKWADGELTRYTANPVEVSLVDNPCVPDATFAYFRAAGAGAELRKLVGSPVHQFWACKVTGHSHETKAEALDCAKAPVPPVKGDTVPATVEGPNDNERDGRLQNPGEDAVPLVDDNAPDDADDLPADDGDDDAGHAGGEVEVVSDAASEADGHAHEQDFKAPTASPGTGGVQDSMKVAARSDTSPKEGESKYGDVTFADAKNKKYPIDTPAHIRAAWNYINKPANSGKYSSADASTIKAKIVAAWKKKIDPKGPPSAADKAATFAETHPELVKGLEAIARKCSIYTVQAIASLAGQASYVEDDLEAQDSDIADAASAITAQIHELLVQAAEEAQSDYEGEEAGEMAQDGYGKAIVAAFEKAETLDVAMVAAELAKEATVAKDEKETMTKLAASEQLSKAVTDGIAKAMEPFAARLEAIEKNVNGSVEVLEKVVERVMMLPAPAKGVLRVVKSTDGDGGAGKETPAEVKKTSLESMKDALAKPSRTF